jgi:acylglycerol lipase
MNFIWNPILVFISICLFLAEGIIVNDSFYSSPRTGVNLYTRKWKTKRLPKAKLLMVHGYSWHSGYFDDFANFLNSHGIDVYSFDLPSHGKSQYVRGIKGYVEKLDNLVDVVEDMVTAIQSTDENPQKVPVFLFGESMGGSLCFLVGLRKSIQEQVKGIIFSGPVFRVSKNVLPPKPVIMIASILAKLFPLMKMPASEMDETYNGAFGNQQYAISSRQDPLVNFDPPRLQTVTEILSISERIPKNFKSFTLPMLILHGQEDIRSEWENSVDFHKHCNSQDKTIQILPQMKHQLLQETPYNVHLIHQELLQWLEIRSK